VRLRRTGRPVSGWFARGPGRILASCRSCGVTQRRAPGAGRESAGISRRVSQGDRACFGFALKQLDQIIVFLEFLLVTLAELISLIRIMPDPPPQFRARRDIL
jgi:hypothetical protein